MPTPENFRKFYDTELVPALASLEVLRRGIYVGLLVFIFVYLFCVFGSVYYFGGFHEFSLSNHTNKDFIVSLLILVAWAVVGVLVYKKLFDKRLAEIRDQFKRSVIVKIVEFVDPTLEYSEHMMIGKDEYIESKIFPIKPQVFRGEDYIVGSEGEVSYKFSELRARNYLKDHRGRKAFLTMFHGLFFIAEFRSQFNGETIVLPDTAQKIFGGFGEFIQKHNIFRDHLIKVDDAEFSREFVVYGDDVEGSKAVLTPALMKRITEFKKMSGHKLYLSFIGNKLNVAIPMQKDLFEPPVFGSMLHFDTIFENYKYLKLSTGIVKDLNVTETVSEE